MECRYWSSTFMIILLILSGHCTNSDRGCVGIKLDGYIHQIQTRGVYVIMASNASCSGHPSYRHTDHQDLVTPYLSFCNNLYNESGWVISPYLCDAEEAVIRVMDGAYTPDTVTDIWEEWNDQFGRWEIAVNLIVDCYKYQYCDFIMVNNTLSQSRVEGVYHRMTDQHTCYNRPVYQQHHSYVIHSQNFIFYCEQKHGNHQWVIGHHNCNDCGKLPKVATADPALCPENVTTSWLELYDGEMVISPNLTVQCYYYSSCETIEVDHSHNYDELHGTYLKEDVSLVCNNRYTYAQTGDSVVRHYLYYHENGWKGWLIGTSRCSEDGVTVRVEDNATTPDHVTENWLEIYQDEWHISWHLIVVCKSEPQVSTTENPALSGGIIAGIVLSSLLVCGVVTLTCITYWCRRKSTTATHDPPKTMQSRREPREYTMSFERELPSIPEPPSDIGKGVFVLAKHDYQSMKRIQKQQSKVGEEHRDNLYDFLESNVDTDNSTPVYLEVISV